MARKVKAWVSSTSRWQRRHKRKLYTASCRQLRTWYPHLVTEDTEKGTYAAYQQWWTDTLSKLNGESERWDKVNAQLDKINGLLEGRIEAVKLANNRIDRALGIATSANTLAALATTYRHDMEYKPETGERVRCDLQDFVSAVGDIEASMIDDTTMPKIKRHLKKRIEEEGLSPNTAKGRLTTVRSFVKWLWRNRYLGELPRNLDAKECKIKGVVRTPKPAPLEQFKLALQTTDEELKLYLLLMANCGNRQTDIATLQYQHCDFVDGRITRKRHKTENSDVPTVSYKLWDDTFKLLKKYRDKTKETRQRLGLPPAGSEDVVLLNEDGKPLKWTAREDDKLKKSDCIKNRWFRHCKKTEGVSFQLDQIRKLGASTLEAGPYRDCVEMYLGEAVSSIAKKHYATPDRKRFDAALVWLRKQILG